jgi:hypothetical protein
MGDIEENWGFCEEFCFLCFSSWLHSLFSILSHCTISNSGSEMPPPETLNSVSTERWGVPNA